MTTTANLRAHLAAHGVDGPPIESGWYVALFIGGEVGIVFCDGRGGIAGAGTAAASWVVKIGREMSIVDGERAARCGSFFAYNIASHAPLSIATTDLSAEVARLQSGRDGRWAMSPRCQGQQAAGHWTGFQCVLDAGHRGHCEPYRAPTVDEWRRLCARAEQMRAQAEDLMAIIESGKDAT